MSDTSLTGLTASINPERLIAILSNSGWDTVGFRERSYVRLKRSDESGVSGPSVVVPLNHAANDFDVVMTAAVQAIRSLGGDIWQRLIEPILALSLVDEFRFRKETSAPRGLIAWKDGEELIDSARRTLIAGAKAYMEPSRHFSNRYGQFAGRYVDQVIMGQSGTGSYVVTALAPADAKVPIRKTDEGNLELDGVNVVSGRDLTSSVVRSLEATMEALDHFKSSGSMSGFDEQVASGVSYELVIALRDVASRANESDITIQLVRMAQLPIADPTSATHQFAFSGGDVSVLDRASVQLVLPTETERLRVEGRVHLLTRKDAGAPGVVGVDDGGHRYRVRLGSDEEYHEAIMAYDEERDIAVVGDLSKEGTLRWLYNAQLLPKPSVVPSDALDEPRGQGELAFPTQEATDESLTSDTGPQPLGEC